LREIFHHEDAKGAKDFYFDFWPAVRGSARVLVLTEIIWATGLVFMAAWL